MNKIIINDCQDQNAKGRQTIRLNSLLNYGPTNFIGVSSDFEAAGCLIDSLDALDGQPGLILVNVAPRNGAAKKWANGTPFGYFVYQGATVISSISGYTLSLVKKLGLVDFINIFPPESIFKELGIEEKQDTQFRSYELTPAIAKALVQGRTLITQKMSLSEIQDIPDSIWWEDCFGNLKTTLLDIPENGLVLNGNSICVYPKLKDVPNGELGLITGSSGIKAKRFLEIVVQGGRASGILGLKSSNLI